MVLIIKNNDIKPRIALFLQDLDGGGAERAIVSLAGDIRKKGYEIDLVIGDANSDYRSEVPSEINVVDFATRSRWRILFNLMAYLRHRNPATVMAALDPPNIMLVIAARLVRFKGNTIVSQRAVLDASLSELKPIHRMILKLLQRICFPLADAVISNSHAAAKEVIKRLHVPKERVVTIQNSLNVELIRQLASESTDSHPFLEVQVPLIISVGSLSGRKDYGTLIRAFKIVKSKRQVNLLIIGEGIERPKLESIISDLNIRDNVSLIGFDANPYKWMDKASVFVSSSKGEGFPNVIAEALSLGLPIVATDCPGDTAELLGHGRWGRLVPVGDPKSMAAAIMAALDDPCPLDVRGRAADFSPAKNTAEYLSILLPKSGRSTDAFHQTN